jgi:hypothetical protein
MRVITKEQFDQSGEIFRKIGDLQLLLQTSSLTLAEKIKIKRRIAELDSERRRILGMDQ